MRKTKYLKIIMGVFIFIIIIVFINIRKHQVFYSSAMELTDLPKFEAVDTDGTKLKSSDLKDKNLYIQFINSKFQPDIDLFESVYSKLISENENINEFEYLTQIKTAIESGKEKNIP